VESTVSQTAPDLEVRTGPEPVYKRVLLKLSGEAFGGGQIGLDPDVVREVARQIAVAVRSGVQVAMVIGGGNFFRGAELQQRGMDRARDGAERLMQSALPRGSRANAGRVKCDAPPTRG